jgi:hypothetical protein
MQFTGPGHASPSGESLFAGPATMRSIVDLWVDALRRLHIARPGSPAAQRALAELERLEAEWEIVAG